MRNKGEEKKEIGGELILTEENSRGSALALLGKIKCTKAHDYRRVLKGYLHGDRVNLG